MEGVSIWQMIILALIILLLFGTKKVRSIGSDLGHAIRSFRQAVNNKEAAASADVSESKSKQKPIVIDQKS